MAGPLLSGGRGGRRSRYSKPQMSDINVTPFVDVMLVLLVVFMITAPMLTQGVDIDLPEAANKPLPDTEEPIQVSIKSGGEVYLQTQPVDEADLGKRLQAIRNVRPNAAIMLRADQGVAYGRVMQVMSALQTAGLTDIGLVTIPPK